METWQPERLPERFQPRGGFGPRVVIQPPTSRRQRLLWRAWPPLAVTAGAFALGLAVSSLAPAPAGVPGVVRVVTEGHVLPSPTRLPVAAPAQPQDHQAGSSLPVTRPGRSRAVPPATRPVPAAPDAPPASAAPNSTLPAGAVPAQPAQVPAQSPVQPATPAPATSAPDAPVSPGSCVLDVVCI